MNPVELTVLADNTVMELIPDKGPVTRLSRPGCNFLAEHGFSVLVTKGGRNVLFDAGVTDLVVPHNLSLLGLDIARDIDAAVLSHGHADHTGSVARLTCNMYALPGVFGPRYLLRNGTPHFELTSPNLLFARERIILQEGPLEVVPGIWATGPIVRHNTWEGPRNFSRIAGDELVEDLVDDDQGLAVVSDQGLVVVSGCAHAGIVNTVLQAREVTGVAQVHAVVGGFHLIDADTEKLERTIEALRTLDVAIVAPTHCTGFAASAALARAFGDRFVYMTGGHRVTV